MKKRLVAGCMTGTSIDGVSAALVEIEGRGLAMSCRMQNFVQEPFRSLANDLRRVAVGAPASAGEFARLARALAKVHAAVLRRLIGTQNLDLICVHGQTVYHDPPISWQLMSPAGLARSFQATVVFDLRAADLAAGGQGAPITPMADWVLFASPEERRAIVNLGGFCNITYLPASRESAAIEQIRGQDVCSCNHILDTIARTKLDRAYDEDGEAALAGRVNARCLEELLALFRERRTRGGSLGTGDECTARIRKVWPLSPEDMCATACAAIGRFVAESCTDVDRILLAGGGTRNGALRRAIEQHASVDVEMTDAAGVACEAREAAAMAVLGALSQDGVPITLSAVTGVKQPPVAGSWIFPESPGARE